jgi:hypothetical protein
MCRGGGERYMDLDLTFSVISPAALEMVGNNAPGLEYWGAGCYLPWAPVVKAHSTFDLFK